MPRNGLPVILLQHRVTIRPYLAWNTWGPAVPVRCLVQDEPHRRHTRAGVVYVKHTAVYAPLGTNCPDGSILTLHDGRTGYAACAVDNEAGTLPVPAHREIWVDVGAVASSPKGETVTLLRKVKVGRDRYHNDRFATEEVAVAGCSVSRLDSDEDNAHGTVVTTRAKVVMPPGTVVKAVDRLRVRGLLFDIDGDPTVLDDPMLAGEGAIEVTIHRKG